MTSRTRLTPPMACRRTRRCWCDELYLFCYGLLALVFCSIVPVATSAQSSTSGTDFLIGFPTNHPMIAASTVNSITVTGVCPTPFCGAIRVSFPACPPGVCPPGSVPLEPVDGIADLFTKTITFAPQASSATGPTAGPYPNRAVRMTSTAPVTVATQVLGPQSADAGTAFSISSLASNYTFASREAGYSWQFAMIIAGASPVTITIPSLPYPALPFTGQGPQTFTLQPYDTYYIRTAGTEEHYNGGDLTGMQLQGTGPFAVIAGVNCANVPQDATACDVVYEQLPPVSGWGTRFIVPTYPLRNSTFFRLVPSADGTTILVNSGVGFAPPPGCPSPSYGPTAPCTFALPGGTVHVLEASSPSLLLMMTPGQGYDNGPGDPSVLHVPHVDALLEEYTFTTFDASYTTQVLVAFEGSDQERDVVADGGAEIDWAWTQITIGSSTFQYGYGTANGTYLLALASGQPLALLIMGYQPWLAVAYTPAYRIVPYALRPAFPPNPAKPSPPAPPSPPTQPPAPPSPDPPSPSTPPPSTPGPSPPSLSPTITSPPFPNLQSGPPLHVLFPLDQCPQRDMAVSPYVLSGPYMTGRRVACFKVEREECGGRRDPGSGGSSASASQGRREQGGSPAGREGGRRGGNGGSGDRESPGPHSGCCGGGGKGGRRGSGGGSCCRMRPASIELLINPACASSNALAGITVNGAETIPVFSTGNFQGAEYGIASVSLWTRSLDPATAGTATTTTGTTATVCFHLEHKGPCSSADKLCLNGQCVFAVVDAGRECCPTSPITGA